MLITRPRRWGKTTILSMVEAFFEIKRTEEEKLKITHFFSKLKIGEEGKKNYLGEIASCPILFLNFYCFSESYEVFIGNVKIMLRKLFLDYYYLCDEMKKQKGQTENKLLSTLIYKYEKLCGNEGQEQPNDDDIKTSLTFLVDLLYDYFEKKKVIVLMDEIDSSILQVIDNNIVLLSKNEPNSPIRKDLKKMKELIYEMIAPLVKPVSPKNAAKIRQIIIAGITDVLIDSSSSPLNEIKNFTMIDPGYQFFGITKNEICELMDKIFLQKDDKKKKEIISDLKRWYNGYSDPCTESVSTYNIYSIMNYFDDCIRHYKKKNHRKIFETKSYWITSSVNGIFQNRSFLRNLDKKFLSKLYDLFVDKLVEKSQFFDPRSNAIL